MASSFTFIIAVINFFWFEITIVERDHCFSLSYNMSSGTTTNRNIYF